MRDLAPCPHADQDHARTSEARQALLLGRREIFAGVLGAGALAFARKSAGSIEPKIEAVAETAVPVAAPGWAWDSAAMLAVLRGALAHKAWEDGSC